MWKRRVRIRQDDNPQNPLTDWDVVGRWPCWHSRYMLGTEQPHEAPKLWLQERAIELDPQLEGTLYNLNNRWYEELLGRTKSHDRACREFERHADRQIHRVLTKHALIVPLWLYDHSLLSIRTGPFAEDSAGWDSGQVGFAFLTREEIKREWGGDWEAARRYVEAVVNTYDQYLQGDVYGFTVELWDAGNGEWVEEDSCWGFYGSDPRTNGMADHLTPDLVEQASHAELEYA